MVGGLLQSRHASRKSAVARAAPLGPLRDASKSRGRVLSSQRYGRRTAVRDRLRLPGGTPRRRSISVATCVTRIFDMPNSYRKSTMTPGRVTPLPGFLVPWNDLRRAGEAPVSASCQKLPIQWLGGILFFVLVFAEASRALGRTARSVLMSPVSRRFVLTGSRAHDRVPAGPDRRAAGARAAQ